MASMTEKFPSPKELEKEIGEFLSRKFGDRVKMVSPVVMAHEAGLERSTAASDGTAGIDFDLKPEELIAELDRYIIKQDEAKAVLATKICTHFNRVRRARQAPEAEGETVGRIKNNVLMIGPTGVGKTYMIRLIARRLGVPFVKGDATKFSETGYVGGDVEDLVRDLVREADDDIDLAECGIIYIDEIDKIASSRHFTGADVSRTGVQRALLKPLEETEVDLKVPHDPISMMQELERFRKTGSRERRTVNTRNILFIVSGAFAELPEIVRQRLSRQQIGFAARIHTAAEDAGILSHVQSEDLVAYGFESEFIGRLPVRAVFERLHRQDLLDILRNPNNPVILSKRLDFAAYGIDVRFAEPALVLLAERAAAENTGARGLVSALERALLPFETHLPSMGIGRFAVTAEAVHRPQETLTRLAEPAGAAGAAAAHRELRGADEKTLFEYLRRHRERYEQQEGLTLTEGRMALVAACYVRQTSDVGGAIARVKALGERLKRIELDFLNQHDINIVLEQEALDSLVEKMVTGRADEAEIRRRITGDFELGLKLIREKTGRQRFFISRAALAAPEAYLNDMIREAMRDPHTAPPALDIDRGSE